MKQPSKRPIRILLILCAAAAAVLAVVALAMYAQEEGQREASRETAANARASVSIETPTPAPTPAPTPTEIPVVSRFFPSDREIDWDALAETNTDIFAWIAVPGTQIDDPLLVCYDNSFYLEHDATKEPSPYGAIFIDMLNNNTLEDPHTVIYGHNMKDGDMFASLHEFEDPAFFQQNQIVKIYTPEGMLQYEIFAAYEVNDNHILYGRDWNDENVFAAYLSEIAALEGEEVNKSGRAVTSGDRIITLSTCVRGESDRRYIVQAVELKNE